MNNILKNSLKKGKFESLYKETPRYRHNLFYRGQLLVFAGYSIVSVETLIATGLGLTTITYLYTLLISSCVLSITAALFLVIKFKKKMLIWQEWLIFGVDLFFYMFFFCLWIYYLNNLRILGLFSSLIAITIVLSYTNLYQSIFMSMVTVICYFSVSCYAITTAGQTGSVLKEAFFVFCLVPAYIIIAFTAKNLEKQRKRLRCAKKELEKVNADLHYLNSSLQYEQSQAELELDLAHEIQESLFSVTPPVNKEWDIAFISKPKYGVSGDFHDFYCTDDRLDGISLFDVSGHGVAPALITILSKPVLYRNFKNNDDKKLGFILDATNEDLTGQLEEVNIYITGILLRIRGNNIEYVNAGHPDLLYFQNSSSSVRVITDHDGKFKGKPIGIPIKNIPYPSLNFTVSSGDVLLLFSDCLIESRNRDGMEFGFNRIEKVFSESAGMDARQVLDNIMNNLNSFIGEVSLIDDLSIIVARKI